MKLLAAFAAVLVWMSSDAKASDDKPAGVVAQKPACDPWTIPARTYRAFGDRLVVYVGDISPQGPAFTLRVLVGSYRQPFLASTGMLTEPSLDKLLASRRDITQQRLEWNPRAKSLVNVSVDGKPVTVRVIRPTAADVAGEVCGLR